MKIAGDKMKVEKVQRENILRLKLAKLRNASA